MWQSILPGISTGSLYPMETEKAVETLLNIGYRTFEIFINASCELEIPFLKELKNKIDAFGAKVVSIHPFTSAMEGVLIFGNYSRREKEGREFYQKYMEAAAFLGAKYVVIHGRMRAPALDKGDAFKRCLEQYAILFQMGKKIGAVPAQENIIRHLSEQPEFIKNMREYLKEECAFVLDLKQCRASHVKITDMLEAMGDRLAHIHLSDCIETGGDMNNCLVPGFGDYDFASFRNLLKARKYTGSIVTEVYGNEFSNLSYYKLALEFTEKIFA